jgi:hypothetical protein
VYRGQSPKGSLGLASIANEKWMPKTSPPSKLFASIKAKRHHGILKSSFYAEIMEFARGDSLLLRGTLRVVGSNQDNYILALAPNITLCPVLITYVHENYTN